MCGIDRHRRPRPRQRPPRAAAGRSATRTRVPARCAARWPRRRAPARPRCSCAGISVPSRRSTRAGRNATRVGGGSRRVRVDGPGRDGAAGPFVDEPGRAIGAESRQSVLLALLEPQARLGTKGVAEGRPADADRIEDGRLDDDVGRRVRRSPTSAPPMTPAIPSGPAGSAISSVSGLELADLTWSSVSMRSPSRARRTTIRPSWTAAASNVWIGLPSSSIT